MGERNRHGLARYVPKEVRREVRQRCGFGCVRCGLAYYDFEHFDPDFKDALRHDPNGITLLCMQCNQKRARGTLSAETVARADKNPRCKQDGFASESFDFGPNGITVNFAGSKYFNCRVILRIAGVDVLSIRKPDAAGEPMLLSGLFSDITGATTLKIEDNVWTAGDDNWDVEVVGRITTIFRAPNDIALQIKMDPPCSISIQKIQMEIEGYYLLGNEEVLQVHDAGGLRVHHQGNVAYGYDVAVNLFSPESDSSSSGFAT
jgi:hypothetical protein